MMENSKSPKGATASSSILLRALFVFQAASTWTIAWQTTETIEECPSDVPDIEWNLNDPNILATGLGFNLEYDMPNCFVEKATFEALTFDCVYPIDTTPLDPNSQHGEEEQLAVNENAPIYTHYEWLDEYYEQSRLKIEVNPDTILEYPAIYDERGRDETEARGILNVCIRLWLWNSQGYQVTFVDAQVSTIVEFPIARRTREKRNLSSRRDDAMIKEHNEKDFASVPTLSENKVDDEGGRSTNDTSSTQTNAITAIRASRDLQGTACRESWGIDVFTCHDTESDDVTLGRQDMPLLPDTPLEQGKFLYLCVQLNDDAVNDGAVLYQVTDLTYYGSTTIQQAIKNGGELSGDGLTSITCENSKFGKQQICKIRSMFYIALFGIHGNDVELGTILNPVPIDIIGSVDITSSVYGRKTPLSIDFGLNMLLQPIAIDTTSSATIMTTKFMLIASGSITSLLSLF